MARQIVVEIIGDDKKFRGTIDGAMGHTSKFGSVLQGIGQGIGQKAFSLIGSAVSGVTDFIGGSIQAASTLEQSIGAVDSVFGDAADTVFKFGDKAAEAFGLSKREVNEFASVMGAQLQGMGYDNDKAAETVLNLQERAADMAATFGGTTADAVGAISALMRGERDSIEKYGVSLKDADIQARILSMGLDTSTVAAEKEAVAIASLDLLMQQTNKTQGQFARESDTMAGSQARANAKFENASAELGKKLLPIATAFFSFLSDTAIPIIMDVINWMAPWIKRIIEVASVIKNTLEPVVRFIGSVMGTVWAAISGYVQTAASRISGFIGTIRGVFTAVADVANTIRDRIKGAWNGVIQFFGGLPGRIAGAARGMWDSIASNFKRVINTVIGAWNSLGFRVPYVDLGPLGKWGGFWIGTPNIPYLHAGGIVPGVPGSDVPAILQAGERVLPMREAGRGGGITINIESFVGSDHDIDKFADRLAMRLRLQGV